MGDDDAGFDGDRICSEKYFEKAKCFTTAAACREEIVEALGKQGKGLMDMYEAEVQKCHERRLDVGQSPPKNFRIPRTKHGTGRGLQSETARGPYGWIDLDCQVELPFACRFET